MGVVGEELNDIGSGDRAAGAALVLEHGEAGDGERRRAFEFSGFEASPEQSIQFLPHSITNNKS